ncbi:hypothetical protein CC86DRAFT_402230 [Ophiobolus disseminans]|uniref:Aminoglycoside phosphotransferase domain-containing protein n=1 Tax=Ophiobolus disseminans TaxID=1469910 RepID=A0A6A7AGL6_9PLEO|nr:hypothetical protein CC86DRAFT_402230 [Ophiobolus disseminans]
MATNDIPLQTLQSTKVIEVGSPNPFDDINQQDPFVLGDSSEADSGREESIYDDASSTISKTSTIEYDQECFTSFQHKAIQLILDLFPGHSASDIHIERMKGGSFNRIIGITLSSPKPYRSTFSRLHSMICGSSRGKPKTGKLKHYILRIPRDLTHSLLHQVKTLNYLEKKLAHPTSKIVRHDSTTNNALGCAYILQERLPGQPLKITNKTGGILSARNTRYELKQSILRIEPHPVPQTNMDINAKLALPQTTRSLLVELCQRQRQYLETSGLTTVYHIWDGFSCMTEDLHLLGFTPDPDAFHFFHADLYSRNLLFTIQSPTSVRLTGILNWDSASFAPKFMSTRAPFFLWSDEDADENEEGDATLEPEDARMRALKRVFEGTVGEKFYKESYKKEAMLARRMWYFLTHGIRNGGDIFLAEEVLEECSAMYP